MKLIAKTSFGLEQYLANELQALGAKNIVAGIRMASFEGDEELMYKVNLWSRIALRVLKPIAKFKAGSEQQLYNEIRKINWSNHISPDDTLAVDAVVNHSVMTHSLYVAQKTKDAIVDQFREKTGKRPSVDLTAPSLRIHVHISADEAEVSLDSSGDSLHKRGYRQQTGEAPMNEALAAGLILLSGWDKQSPFLDLMCGSGTIVIEAAMMALNIAPGSLRKEFGFQRWKDFKPAIWKQLKSEAAADAKKNLDFSITGVDQSSFAIRYAKENAESAGVLNYIAFHSKPFEEFTPADKSGMILMNPPYGGRITSPDLLSLYKGIGDQFKKKYAGWNAFVFTANKDAAKHIGLRPSKKIPLYNGKLECRLLKFEMYAGSKRVVDNSVQ